LKEDLKRRKNKTEIVKKASLKYEMDPEVVKTYLEEYEYLSDAADALREYLYL
jgi:predicted solute-binding protein